MKCFGIVMILSLCFIVGPAQADIYNSEDPLNRVATIDLTEANYVENLVNNLRANNIPEKMYREYKGFALQSAELDNTVSGQVIYAKDNTTHVATFSRGKVVLLDDAQPLPPAITGKQMPMIANNPAVPQFNSWNKFWAPFVYDPAVAKTHYNPQQMCAEAAPYVREYTCACNDKSPGTWHSVIAGHNQLYCTLLQIQATEMSNRQYYQRYCLNKEIDRQNRSLKQRMPNYNYTDTGVENAAAGWQINCADGTGSIRDGQETITLYPGFIPRHIVKDSGTKTYKISFLGSINDAEILEIIVSVPDSGKFVKYRVVRPKNGVLVVTVEDLKLSDGVQTSTEILSSQSVGIQRDKLIKIVNLTYHLKYAHVDTLAAVANSLLDDEHFREKFLNEGLRLYATYQF